MTLQHQLRSLWEDRLWQRRIALSNSLLLETVDWWCRSDSDFPVAETVAGILHLFSPRCSPDDLRATGIREHLPGLVRTPDIEYSQTWPKRTDVEKNTLIAALTEVLSTAVDSWTTGGLHDPTIDSVNRQITSLIVAEQYVVFHHKQTTRRDFGGFYTHG